MNKSLSHQVRLIRESKGYSQAYVAKKMKVTQQAYSQMEKNPESMTLKKLKELSLIFDVELITLLGEENVYVQQNYQQTGGNAATKMVIQSNKENNELYERMISELKNEILFLKDLIQKLNN